MSFRASALIKILYVFRRQRTPVGKQNVKSVHFKDYDICPSISCSAYPTQGPRGAWSLSNGTKDTLQSTKTLIHTLGAIQRWQSAYNTCLWTGEGDPSTQRKPLNHMLGASKPNPRGVRQTNPLCSLKDSCLVSDVRLFSPVLELWKSISPKDWKNFHRYTAKTFYLLQTASLN